MRGKDCGVADMVLPVRITPAYAGKRRGRRHPACSCRDHPRICGEKSTRTKEETHEMGSPPRMRGKVNDGVHDKLRLGITPAYAGKRALSVTTMSKGMGSPPRMRGKATPAREALVLSGITPAYAGKSCAKISRLYTGWDHPRVCGEKEAPDGVAVAPLGSPPRMRGKGALRRSARSWTGITPAYAGKSWSHRC